MIPVKNERSEVLSGSTFGYAVATNKKYIATQHYVDLESSVLILDRKTEKVLFEIKNPHGRHLYDGIGQRLAMNEKYLFIGAKYASTPEDDLDESYSGLVYVVDLSAMRIITELSLSDKPLTSRRYCMFGSSIAICGDYLAVASDSYNDESNPTTYSKSGIVRIYNLDTWTVARDIKSPVLTANEFFGRSISANDSKIIISGGLSVKPYRIYNLADGVLEYELPTGQTSAALSVAMGKNLFATRHQENSSPYLSSIKVYDLATKSFLYNVDSDSANGIKRVGDKVFFENDFLVHNSYESTPYKTGASATLSHYTVTVRNALTGTVIYRIKKDVANENLTVRWDEGDTDVEDLTLYAQNLHVNGEDLFISADGTYGYYEKTYPLIENTQERVDALTKFVGYIDRIDIYTGNDKSVINYPYPRKYDRNHSQFGISIETSSKYLIVGARQEKKQLDPELSVYFRGRVHVFDVQTNAHLFGYQNPATADIISENALAGRSCIMGEKVFYLDMGDGFELIVATLENEKSAISKVATILAAGNVYGYEVMRDFSIPTIPSDVSLGFLRRNAVKKYGNKTIIAGTYPNTIISGVTISVKGIIAGFIASGSGNVYFAIPNPSTGVQFGSDIAICENYMIVGDVRYGSPTTGAVYIYAITGDTVATTPVRTIIGPTAHPDAYADYTGTGFGETLFADATRFAVGMPGWDAYNHENFINEESRDWTFLRYNQPGEVRVYNPATGTLIRKFVEPDYDELMKSNPKLGDFSAFGVSIDMLGDLIAIGAPGRKIRGYRYSGSVYVFKISNGQLIQRIDNPAINDSEGGCFGHAIKLTEEGIIISAPGAATEDGIGAGVVYIYKNTFLDGFDPYQDSVFKDACALAKNLTREELLIAAESFSRVQERISEFMMDKFKSITSTVYKLKMFEQFWASKNMIAQDLMDTIDLYTPDIQDLISTMDTLTEKYQALTGQPINFYNLKNTTDFSVLPENIVTDLVSIGDSAKTISVESKKMASDMLELKNGESSLGDIASALYSSQKRIIALVRELQTRSSAIDLELTKTISAVYVLEKMITGKSIAELEKMPSKEREVYLNERYY